MNFYVKSRKMLKIEKTVGKYIILVPANPNFPSCLKLGTPIIKLRRGGVSPPVGRETRPLQIGIRRCFVLLLSFRGCDSSRGNPPSQMDITDCHGHKCPRNDNRGWYSTTNRIFRRIFNIKKDRLSGPFSGIIYLLFTFT